MSDSKEKATLSTLGDGFLSVIVGAACLLVLSGCATPAHVASSTTSRVTYERAGVSFLMPSDWYVRDDSGGPVCMQLSRNATKFLDASAEHLAVIVFPGAPTKETSLFLKTTDDAIWKPAGAIMAAGVTAQVLEYSGAWAFFVDVKGQAVTIQHPLTKEYLVFDFVALESKYDLYHPVLENALDSLSFTLPFYGIYGIKTGEGMVVYRFESDNRFYAMTLTWVPKESEWPQLARRLLTEQVANPEAFSYSNGKLSFQQTTPRGTVEFRGHYDGLSTLSLSQRLPGQASWSDEFILRRLGP